MFDYIGLEVPKHRSFSHRAFLEQYCQWRVCLREEFLYDLHNFDFSIMEEIIDRRTPYFLNGSKNRPDIVSSPKN